MSNGVNWFIPADFMYGDAEEDYDKVWPKQDAELNVWMEFIMQILNLTGQHPAGHRIVVSIAKLTEHQIQCALNDMRRRDWLVSINGTAMTIQSRELCDQKEMTPQLLEMKET